MTEAFKPQNLFILILSIMGLYLLAPNLGPDNGLLLSLSYGLILIVSSRVIWDRIHLIKYAVFLGIDALSYFMLFNDQPWDFLFGTGVWAASAAPLIGCSVIMSFAGWLLIKEWRHRWWYLGITLGLQIPIGLFIGGDMLQGFFESVGHMLRMKGSYPDALQIWQFEWMLTYYLPIYFFARSKKNS